MAHKARNKEPTEHRRSIKFCEYADLRQTMGVSPRSQLTQPQLRSIDSVPIDASAMAQTPVTRLKSITTRAEPELPATCTAMWTYMVEPTKLSL